MSRFCRVPTGPAWAPLLRCVLAAAGLTAVGVATPGFGADGALRDLNGREIAPPLPATRIVALPAPAGPTLLAADQSVRHLIGVHKTMVEIARGGLLGTWFPEVLNLDTALLTSGGSAFMPNVEAIAALAPDLVIQRGELGEGVVAPLTEAGLRVGLVAYGDEARARANIAFLSTVTGAGAHGEAMLDWRQAVAERLRSENAQASTTPPLSVIFLSRGAAGWQATGGDTPNDVTITLAGGRNVAGDRPGSLAVGPEQLLTWNPDVILLNSADPSLTPADIYADPLLAASAAAVAKRVYKVPVGVFRWEPPNPENPLFWLWLGALLDPGRHAYDVRAEIGRGLALIYGITPTPGALDQILQLGANAGALHYERLAR